VLASRPLRRAERCFIKLSVGLINTIMQNLSRPYILHICRLRDEARAAANSSAQALSCSALAGGQQVQWAALSEENAASSTLGSLGQFLCWARRDEHWGRLANQMAEHETTIDTLEPTLSPIKNPVLRLLIGCSSVRLCITMLVPRCANHSNPRSFFVSVAQAFDGF